MNNPPRAVDIVLVHGAFADGSSWSKVIALLQQKGYRVTAVQNPLSSLAADVAAATRAIERQPHSVLLVGHSWAGAVISEAGNHHKVAGLVYLSALTPDSNESVGQLLQRLKAPMEGMRADHDGLIWLDDPQSYGQVTANDLPPQDVKALAAVQTPIAALVFNDRIGHAAWHDKPSWYMVTQNDHALPTETQLQLAAMIGARTERINASHMAMVSHPDQVAEFIDQAARSLR